MYRMKYMRLQTLFVLTGITFIILSYTVAFIDISQMTRIHIENPEEYEGRFFECSNMKYIRVREIMNHTFTLYLLDYENGIRAFAEQSLENVSVYEIHQNITSYDGLIRTQNNRWLVILLKPDNSTEEINCIITITPTLPDVGLFSIGLLLSLLGVFGILVVLYTKHKRNSKSILMI